MPYLRVSVAQKLAEEERKELVKGLGDALALIPGKDGRMLIAEIDDGKKIYLGGELQENCVFVDVRYYSNFSYQVKKKFTGAVFHAIRSVLGTGDDRMFLTISEFNSWGGFGDFKDEYYSE